MIQSSTESLIVYEINRSPEPSADRFTLFFRYYLDNLSQGNRLHLFSLFSKISYLDGRYNYSDEELRAFHCVRKFIESGREVLDKKTLRAFQLSIRTFLALTSELTRKELRLEQALKAWKEVDDAGYDVIHQLPLIRASILSVDHERHLLVVLDEQSGQRWRAKFNVPEVNEQFNVSISHLENRIELPVIANFLENKFVKKDVFVPAAIVIDPDYLIDVTAIAESFTPDMELPLIYLMRQFLPKASSPHLVLGNIANTVLDRFMLGEKITYESLMSEMFQLFALDFTQLKDDDVRMVSQQSRQLIQHLFHDVNELKRENENAIAYIEPSFISALHGIQGRLDALFLDENYLAGKIVELKSGKPYRENEFGLSRNHYVQTLLYDMIVRKAFGDDFQSTNYILYCKLSKDRLKQAPAIKSVQFDALKVRNDVVAIMHHLKSKNPKESLLFRFNHAVLDQAGGFVRRDAQRMHAITSQLTPFERVHFLHFVSLLTCENYAAKVGGQLGRNGMGFSSLWQRGPEEKERNYTLYRKLKIVNKIESGIYRFQIDEMNELANFRRGDIIVLYPNSRENAPISGQLLKGSLISVSPEFVEIRLRNPLLNAAVFESIEYWNAEHDFIESSARHGYRSLLTFYQMKPGRRARYLGLTAPKAGGNDEVYRDDVLTKQQNELLNELILADDYYLLWGPPGTGKTSVMLAAFVRYIMTKTSESLLLVAYTNRAVDEICEVLENNYAEDYIRVGSRFSVPEKFQPKLLQNKLKSLNSRREVRKRISNCRLFVGTLASISGKEELFAIKSFERMVVDEASQILEPHLLGLIARVKKSILIGDHKQLPAVVVSPLENTIVEDAVLRKAGYENTAISLFERLFRKCESENWSHVIGRLNKQGRMHERINEFVANHFYENQLAIIDHVPELRQRLTASLSDFYVNLPEWNKRSLSNRIEIVPVVEPRENFELLKTSEAEACATDEICAEILKALPGGATLGVICPFRAQIALIKQKVETRFGKLPEQVTVDTVERYQGGSRDVVIISTCAGNKKSLDAIRSIDFDGIDRKLNVALSRSKEQIILIGNIDVLSRDSCYRELFNYAKALV